MDNQEKSKRWGFLRKWKWRFKAYKHMGIIAFLFPYSDEGFAHPILGSFYTASTPLLALPEEERKERAPFLEEVYKFSEFIEPYLYGDEKIEKEGSLEKVYTEAERFFLFMKELEGREPEASWLIRKIVSGYLTDVAIAFDFLCEIEGDKNFCRLKLFFEFLGEAFDYLDEECLYKAKTLL